MMSFYAKNYYNGNLTFEKNDIRNKIKQTKMEIYSKFFENSHMLKHFHRSSAWRT